MQNLTKLFDDRSRYAKGLLTRLRKEKTRYESAKLDGKIYAERHEMPRSQFGLWLKDLIIEIEKAIRKK